MYVHIGTGHVCTDENAGISHTELQGATTDFHYFENIGKYPSIYLVDFPFFKPEYLGESGVTPDDR